MDDITRARRVAASDAVRDIALLVPDDVCEDWIALCDELKREPAFRKFVRRARAIVARMPPEIRSLMAPSSIDEMLDGLERKTGIDSDPA